MRAPIHETPGPKAPLKGTDTVKPRSEEERRIDKQMKDTFPASDPPSYSGGNHAIGAPKGRESEAAKADTPEVVAAEKQVKDGKVAPHKY